MTSRINHLAVFVSAVVFFLLGWVWYTLLFGSLWLAQTGKAAGPAGTMTTQLAVSFLMGWILAYVIGIALADTGSRKSARQGVEFGVFIGVGVFATMTLVMDVYEGRSMVLWLIDAGYVVVSMAAMGAIIGGWRTQSVTSRAI